AEFQVRLLRVLETATLLRVGGEEQITIDIRVVAATNRIPEAAVTEGKLREDLLYRLGVFPIRMPPLRERGDDIPLLAQHFLDGLNAAEETEKRWTMGALRAIAERPWRGNVRELRNVVHQAFILADREIAESEIRTSEPIHGEREPVSTASGGTLEVAVGSEIAAVEKKLILATLEHFEGDKKKAAHALGISLKTLYNRLSVYRAGSESGAG
ncbi:MAG TPA: sigma 54-interacting transcriptional regulator, partial [Myxococcota bacterium]|nr:sigma 54-interacting transcriptional regulator [Myxococcota bacterium]